MDREMGLAGPLEDPVKGHAGGVSMRAIKPRDMRRLAAEQDLAQKRQRYGVR
jgi:hypothetical protein